MLVLAGDVQARFFTGRLAGKLLDRQLFRHEAEDERETKDLVSIRKQTDPSCRNEAVSLDPTPRYYYCSSAPTAAVQHHVNARGHCVS